MNDSEESSKIIGRLKSPWTSFDKSDPKNDPCGRRQRPFFEAFPPLDFAGNYVEQARWGQVGQVYHWFHRHISGMAAIFSGNYFASVSYHL